MPNIMCPKESGYGDYIIMDINDDGTINDWCFDERDIDDFIDEN